jgi:hypothetical protein
MVKFAQALRFDEYGIVVEFQLLLYQKQSAQNRHFSGAQEERLQLHSYKKFRTICDVLFSPRGINERTFL